MRPHSGKPKTGFKEGRNKLRSSNKPKQDDTSSKKAKNLLDDAQDVVDDYLEESLLDEGDSKKKADRFAREFRRLRRDIGASNEHFNPDKSSARMLRALLVMTLDMIPLAEEGFRKTRKESAAYALNALMNQARELQTELRMSKDYEGQAIFIRDNILSPIFKSFTQNMLNEHQHLKNTIDTNLRDKESKKIKAAVDDVTRALGKFLSEMITKSFTDVDNYLQGNMQALMPSSGKKSRKKGFN